MEFLKAILGDELYSQVAEKINAHNGNGANKEAQIKIANLGGGEYVGKGKFDALTEQLNGKQKELDTANGLIAELKKGTKGNEELQGKISGYETQVADLQKQLQETKINSALKLALLGEKAVDVDYLTFKVNEKLREQGKSLELDENENIKGVSDLLSGLKTQFPAQFGKPKASGIEPNPLPNNNSESGMTKADFLKKPYAERAAFARENPEAFKELFNNK